MAGPSAPEQVGWLVSEGQRLLGQATEIRHTINSHLNRKYFIGFIPLNVTVLDRHGGTSFKNKALGFLSRPVPSTYRLH